MIAEDVPNGVIITPTSSVDGSVTISYSNIYSTNASAALSAAINVTTGAIALSYLTIKGYCMHILAYCLLPN